MSNENNFKNSEKEKADEKPFLKGWQDFIGGITEGFESFKTSLEKQSTKNKEFLEENKDNVNKFFSGVKEDWDKQIQKWSKDIEQRNIETKEQWDAHKQKIGQDYKNWQEKTQQKWEEGVKAVRKGFFRAYLWALLLIIPVLVIVIIVIRLLGFK